MGNNHAHFSLRCLSNSLLPGENNIQNKTVWLNPEYCLIAQRFSGYRLFIEKSLSVRAYADLRVHFISLYIDRPFHTLQTFVNPACCPVRRLRYQLSFSYTPPARFRAGFVRFFLSLPASSFHPAIIVSAFLHWPTAHPFLRFQSFDDARQISRILLPPALQQPRVLRYRSPEALPGR